MRSGKLETERWRMIVGYDDYAVSDRGRVIALSTGKYMKFRKNPKGYLRVHLPERRVLVHRIVAQAFLPAPKDGQTQINHISGNKADNRVVNLEWVTPSENLIHSYRKLGRKATNVVPVICLETKREWGSAKEAASQLAINYRTFMHALNFGYATGNERNHYARKVK